MERSKRPHSSHCSLSSANSLTTSAEANKARAAYGLPLFDDENPLTRSLDGTDITNTTV
jgi:hypothetical protein